MQENGTVSAAEENGNTNTAQGDETTNNQTDDNQTTDGAPTETVESNEDISYHTVEKDGNVTAIWEMQGRKHIRTIDPRSSEGKHILELFETAA